jgi:deoxyribose-phosphate aldolase
MEIAMPRINLPDDAEAKIRRAVRNAKKPGIVAVCLWCGHGYTKYNHEIIEDEHFANVCPNAPEPLKANAKRRLVTS